MNQEKSLGVFLKAPRPGEVKTRLGKDIGMKRAAEFYAVSLGWFLARLDEHGILPYLFFAPANAKDYIRSLYSLSDDISMIPQQGEDLGERMRNAFEWMFSNKPNPAFLVGSDSPDLPMEFIDQARTELEENDVVIGPADDGGYYLIGLRELSPSTRKLFDGISWSEPTVFEETLTRVCEENLSFATLPGWNDVDTLDDLKQKLEIKS